MVKRCGFRHNPDKSPNPLTIVADVPQKPPAGSRGPRQADNSVHDNASSYAGSVHNNTSMHETTHQNTGIETHLGF